MRKLVGSILLAGVVLALQGSGQVTPSSCADRLNATVSDLPVPSLLPPAGATVSRQGSGNSAADFRCVRTLNTKLEPVALTAHYETQMAALGWQISDRNREDASMAATLFSGSATAKPLTAMLVVTALQDTALVDVVLRIIRHDAPGDERLATSGAGRPGARTGGSGAGATSAAPSSAMLQGFLSSSPLGEPGEVIAMHDRLPLNFPRDLLPAGAEVRFAAVSPSRTTVVAVAAGLSPYSVSSLQAQLHGHGWLGRRGGSGFAADVSMPIARPTEYCRGEETATVNFRSIGGVLVVRASHARVPGRSCSNTPAQVSAFADVPMPLLVPPAPMSSGGGGGGLDVYDGETRVQSPMTAGEISKNFANQLGLGGWKVAQQARLGARATVLRARHATIAGDPVTALVATTSLAGTPRVDLWVHVVRHKPLAPPRR